MQFAPSADRRTESEPLFARVSDLNFADYTSSAPQSVRWKPLPVLRKLRRKAESGSVVEVSRNVAALLR